MIKEIRAEGDGVCNMPGRIRAMADDQLAIYVNFLENRRIDDDVSDAIKKGITEILTEATTYASWV